MASDEHARGVVIARRWLLDEGYTPEPVPKTGRHRADDYGEMHVHEPGRVVVRKRLVEVETSRSVLGREAKEQMAEFAKWASEFDTREAVVFVPAGSLDDARVELHAYDVYVEFAVGE